MYDGNAWHGPGILDALRGVTAAQAAAHPVPGAHSILELAHHVAAWMDESRWRLLGERHREPPMGDFPEAGAPTDEAAWDHARERLALAQRDLVEAARAFDPARLDDPVDPAHQASHTHPTTFAALISGVVQHNAYHAGQVVLLKRALGAA
jgi:uncharacterized damage-inducible protein DinB